jgi:methylenetetrahydrofolate dehydrogenase (NADP+)/methenyltetrahydrofolate cyclohydrolase
MDGRAVAAEIKERLKREVQSMKRKGVEPFLATILVGNDPASTLYVGNKHKAAQEVGIKSENHELPANTDEQTLTQLLEKLNNEKRVNGILLQMPLPPPLDALKMVEKINPEKDVDGLTSANMGRLFYNKGSLVPCTPLGIMTLLHHYNVKIRGANAVIINRSSLVGKPLFHLLLAEDATVTSCHSKSVDIPTITSHADILVSAVGRRPQFVVTAEMVKEGSTVVDVAMNRIEGRWYGDVDFDAVSKKASYITPVPGGVGPMTIATLLENTVRATMNQMGES